MIISPKLMCHEKDGDCYVDLSHLQGEDFDLDGVRESLSDFLEVEWWQVAGG